MIGRFINADTLDVLPVSPTSFTDKNLYAYCDNNPVMRKDSDGAFWNIAAGAIIGGAISAATQIVSNVIAGEKWSSGVLMAAVTGAASGALSATGFATGVQIAANGIIGFLGEGINQIAQGKDIKTAGKAAIKAGIAGAISGAIGKNGIRHKSGDYYKAAQNAKSTAEKIFVQKKYSSSQTVSRLINRAAKNVKYTGYKESWKTGWKFFLGSANGQVLTRWG